MKNRLLVTSTDLMMVQFLLPHIHHLADSGYEVEIACSDVGGRLDEVRKKISNKVKVIYKVDLQRSPMAVSNFRGFRHLKEIIDNGNYDIIWTNEPVMGVATRLAAREARKCGTKVLYMVHGFHFLNGGPILNWLLYYPVERLMASKADVICTVNNEDFQRAKRFNVKRVEYIHGIGINTSRLSNPDGRKDIRKELGLKDNAFLLLSVGELNKNKNQATVIKAVASLHNPEIYYLICGKGAEEDNLRQLVSSLNLSENVHFLGYRTDVMDICSQADVYVMPSFREGLPVSSLEAMYCGLPLVTSNIRGLNDVNKEGVNGYLCRPADYDKFSKNIDRLYRNIDLRKKIGKRNKEDVKSYTIDNTLREVKDIIDSLRK